MWTIYPCAIATFTHSFLVTRLEYDPVCLLYTSLSGLLGGDFWLAHTRFKRPLLSVGVSVCVSATLMLISRKLSDLLVRV